MVDTKTAIFGEYRPLQQIAPGNTRDMTHGTVVGVVEKEATRGNPGLTITRHKKTVKLGEGPSVVGLSFMFALIFLPMLSIVLLLLCLVLFGKVNFTNENDTNLPVYGTASSGVYYTVLLPGKFALVSSWASTIVGNITAPFLTLFSFLIARYIAKLPEDAGESGKSQEHFEHNIRTILHSRTFSKLWRWIKSLAGTGDDAARNGATVVAVVGVGITLLFVALILVGDNWLHLAVTQEIYRNFTAPYVPKLNQNADYTSPDSPVFLFASGFTTASICDNFVNSSDTTDELPCSLTNKSYYNIQNPSWVYTILNAGISNNSTDFSTFDFNQEQQAEDSGTAVGTQVLTYQEQNTKLGHSFLFYVNAAQQVPATFNTSKGHLPVDVSNDGFDFIAPAYSMSTECVAANPACDLQPNSPLYNCSSIFTGNLTQEPSDGRQKVPGWNSTFYTIENGVAREMTLGENQNPFQFNVTVNLDALSDQLSPNRPLEPPLIQTDAGNVGFALSCSATVYKVNYTLINSAIVSLNAIPASPQIASIIRAPLQVGYGRYNLYQFAISAALSFSGDDLGNAMAKSFSQMAIALSSGAFDYTTNIIQRERWDVTVTIVPKALVWFLATVCALYALVALVVFVIALVLRKDAKIREAQKRLGLDDVNDVIRKAENEYTAGIKR